MGLFISGFWYDKFLVFGWKVLKFFIFNLVYVFEFYRDMIL